MYKRQGVLLDRARAGDAAACEALLPLVYQELRQIAARHLRRERPDHTLQPTALVNEAYLKLFGPGAPDTSSKAHFLALASQVMRRVLVDYARSRNASKRGGGVVERVDAEEARVQEQKWDHAPLLELDRALTMLAEENPELARAIEMRYFGGLTAEEAAQVTGRSVHVVRHDLRFAQAWLRRALEGGESR